MPNVRVMKTTMPRFYAAALLVCCVSCSTTDVRIVSVDSTTDMLRATYGTRFPIRWRDGTYQIAYPRVHAPVIPADAFTGVSVTNGIPWLQPHADALSGMKGYIEFRQDRRVDIRLIIKRENGDWYPLSINGMHCVEQEGREQGGRTLRH